MWWDGCCCKNSSCLDRAVSFGLGGKGLLRIAFIGCGVREIAWYRK